MFSDDITTIITQSQNKWITITKLFCISFDISWRLSGNLDGPTVSSLATHGRKRSDMMTCHVGPCVDCGTRHDVRTWRTVMSARHLCPCVTAFVCIGHTRGQILTCRRSAFCTSAQGCTIWEFRWYRFLLEGYRMITYSVLSKLYSVSMLHLVDRDWLIVWILVYCQRHNSNESLSACDMLPW